MHTATVADKMGKDLNNYVKRGNNVLVSSNDGVDLLMNPKMRGSSTKWHMYSHTHINILLGCMSKGSLILVI